MAFAATETTAERGPLSRLYSITALVADGAGPFTFAHGLTAPVGRTIRARILPQTIGSVPTCVSVVGANIQVDRAAPVGADLSALVEVQVHHSVIL